MSSKTLIVRTDPVQEIAAEPATLDLLKDLLRPGHRAIPETFAAPFGLPLVYDETLAPGVIHCRPSHPGAVEPPSAAETLEYLCRLMPTTGEPPQ